MADQVRYLRQTVDYLGTLQTKLRDLRGIATLAYELIQNADDVLDEQGHPTTTRIAFDIRDDALIVENDGVFRDVDFDRIANIASGGKREEEGTTGAFGIGFISVYQITDSPEIFSNGLHWRICPQAQDNQRIEERQVQTDGTRFRLPWAFDPQSEVRCKLRVEAVKPKQLPNFAKEIGQAISRASLFLKHLEVLEVKNAGQTLRRIERLPEKEDQILIGDDSQTRCWYIFRGSFQKQANQLRAQHRLQIEDKRQSQVLVAIPDELMDNGRLYAVLPSETTVPLPFHINADFFPSSDRKRIIFDDDYQSNWNRAAISAAAQTLAENLIKLPEMLGHRVLWQLLNSLNECRRTAEQGKLDSVFSKFWHKVAPSLSIYPIVFTTQGQWVKSGEARLLESDVEMTAVPILEKLGIQVVHSDLRPFFGLLRQSEINTPLLSVQDITDALKRVGLDKPTRWLDVPSYLKNLEAWQTLWNVLNVLLEKKSLAAQQRQLAEESLCLCAIALDDSKTLRLPTELFKGDAETRDIFEGIRWLQVPELDGVPTQLVPEFTPVRAIEHLSGLPEKQLQEACRANRLDIKALYQWFEARRDQILSDPAIKSKLQNLAIWPAGDEFHSLLDVYIPGGFDDPFKLSLLIDLEALGGRTDFLRDMGVQELTFSVYAHEQVPRVLRERTDLPVQARQELVQLLAQRLGEIRDDRQVGDALRSLNLIECTDGVFRPAGQAYLKSNVVQILESRVHIAADVQRNVESVRALYRWLGAATEPRPTDVLEWVQELSKGKVSEQSRQAMKIVFEYLVNRWESWGESQRQAYRQLQTIAWLPATGDQSRWYRPKELFAIFQKYLFETQARFLDLPKQIQDQAGRVALISFLEIKDKPTPIQVVRHLLTCSEQGQVVNPQVYRFLNDNAEHRAVGELKGKPCLLLPNESYVRPDQVYWGEHPFGPFRYQLGPEMRRYDAFLDNLNVKEKPSVQDYIRVLVEISKQYGKSHKILDQDADAVLMRCWETLSTALDEKQVEAEDLAVLRSCEVIPDSRRLLTLPEHMFFEDRVGLAAKFDLLKYNVVQRPKGAWRAMEAVGVQLLWQATRIHLLECEDPIDDQALVDRIQKRRKLLDRVIESEKASEPDALDIAVMDNLQCLRTDKLVIQYSIQVFKKREESIPEPAPALWIPKERVLYNARTNGKIAWPAVARELAHALKPVGEIGGLASGITNALSGSSFDEANQVLDMLGYPPLQQVITQAISSPDMVTGFGSREATEETEEGQLLAQGTESTDSTAQLPESKIAPDDTFAQSEERPSGTDTLGTEEPSQVTPSEQKTDEQPSRDGDTTTSKGVTKKKPARSRYKRKGKLRTYVLPDGFEQKDEPDSAAARHRSEVDQAGIVHVLAYEYDCGRTPTEMPHANRGYDVKSVSSLDGERLIEVKSLSGLWSERSAAGLTRPQFEMARDKGDRFWLYVVERATSEDWQLYRIQNPANQVNQYLFDDGWQSLAEYDVALG